MANRNRETLKRYFAKGQMPSQESFFDLIDSMYNIIDDGTLEKSNSNELNAVPNDKGTAVGLYKQHEDVQQKSPEWSINYDNESEHLSIRQHDGKDVFSLAQDGRVGINTNKPASTLDVNGNISSKGRIGNYVSATIPADGEWHSVINKLNACYLFEIVAGTRGSQKSGKFALMHAIAATTFNSKNKIRTTQAYYGSYFHRIRLRWHGTKDDFALQVKTSVDYGKMCTINVQITNLWQDNTMESFPK